MDEVRSFLKFAAQSPTSFHATASEESILRENGFHKLGAFDTWSLVPGGKYYCTRNGSSLIAFVMPQSESFDHFQLVCSHSDSPCFVIKENAEDAVAHVTRLSTEGYGGMILSTWLDKPLGIAGRVYVRAKGGALECRLVDFGRDMCVIPNMCVHLMRDINKGYVYNPQTDLRPLWGMEGAKSLRAHVKDSFLTEDEEIVSMELFLYNRTPGTVFGDDCFFSSPRIDNLECAYASLQAFQCPAPEGTVNVYAVFDNEEVGSTTKQGANSDFLRGLLETVCELSGKNARQTRAAIAASVMVSADNAHAVHPNHPECMDTQNGTYMNGGVVIKRAANQKYTTDAISEGMFLEICRRSDVPTQVFHNRSDIIGGSTLGNLANIHASMCTVDIGLAQLSMHSCYETAGSADLLYMLHALRTFYSTRIEMGDGSIHFQ